MAEPQLAYASIILGLIGRNIRGTQQRLWPPVYFSHVPLRTLQHCLEPTHPGGTTNRKIPICHESL